ncbi:MAG TPA: N-6 DNA methylase, partial [Myxococcota bacterium]|nr:N-6 DNA methylase [Myxococcota bacterium]
TWLRESGALSRVNWRDMGPEELGSVYESLLELVPRVSLTTRSFSFAEGDETRGNARKTSGSYYTPDSLVHVLLDSALEPVVAATLAAHPTDPVEALLRLSIVDPACGSGHFLLAAARRLAGHVARLMARGTPTPPDYRRALRRVVGACIYGVDLNPMAVELCKVALWMEALEPGRPLTFLDAHIRTGNALVGATRARMADGIPDEAWDPIEGDNKEVAKRLKKRNKTGAQVGLFTNPTTTAIPTTAPTFETEDDGTTDGLHRKAEGYKSWLSTSNAERSLADLWTAAFLWPKQPGRDEDAAPTSDLWRTVKTNAALIPAATTTTVHHLREQYRFFHWEVEFPSVFTRGGFDVVLGNPPWDQLQLDAREWFASKMPDLANAQHLAARLKSLESLKSTNPALHQEFLHAKRQNEGTQAF